MLPVYYWPTKLNQKNVFLLSFKSWTKMVAAASRCLNFGRLSKKLTGHCGKMKFSPNKCGTIVYCCTKKKKTSWVASPFGNIYQQRTSRVIRMRWTKLRFASWCCRSVKRWRWDWGRKRRCWCGNQPGLTRMQYHPGKMQSWVWNIWQSGCRCEGWKWTWLPSHVWD